MPLPKCGLHGGAKDIGEIVLSKKQRKKDVCKDCNKIFYGEVLRTFWQIVIHSFWHRALYFGGDRRRWAKFEKVIIYSFDVKILVAIIFAQLWCHGMAAKSSVVISNLHETTSGQN